jgi:hypothetical protein
MLTLILGVGGGAGRWRKAFGTFNSREFRRGLLASDTIVHFFLLIM